MPSRESSTVSEAARIWAAKGACLTSWFLSLFLLSVLVAGSLNQERHWLVILFWWAPPALYLGLWVAVSGLDLAVRTRAALPLFVVNGALTLLAFSGFCWHIAPSPEARISALTFNIRAGLGGPEELGDFLQKQKVDIVALQEARVPSAVPNGRDPWPVVSGRLTGYNSVRGGRKNELVIATPHQILRTKEHPLNEWSSVLEAEIDLHGIPLRALNVHCVMGNPRNTTPAGLELSALARHQQGRSLVEIIRNSELPTLLLGDFNTPPGSVLYNQIADVMTDSFRQSGWGFGWTFPQDRPLLRIDYIWCKGLEPCRSQVIDSGLSDHRLIRSEFGQAGFPHPRRRSVRG